MYQGLGAGAAFCLARWTNDSVLANRSDTSHTNSSFTDTFDTDTSSNDTFDTEVFYNNTSVIDTEGDNSELYITKTYTYLGVYTGLGLAQG